MGEGRNDYSSKRHKSCTAGKSSSHSEIAHRDSKGVKGKERAKNKVRERWPFSEELTVDELARYRRRRVQARPKDNFQPYPESPDLVEDPASEYRRAFGANLVEEPFKRDIWPIKNEEIEGYLQTEEAEAIDNAQPLDDLGQHEAIQDPSVEQQTAPCQSVHLHEMMKMRAGVLQLETSFRRPPLIRRNTSLKCSGDFYTDTEMYSAYVPYVGQHRAELLRRPTSLRMEGDLDTMTEKCEKFVEWLNVGRPELMRIPTHLKMEGELETTTENHDRYVPFVGARRPELLRRNTNLKLEGDTYLVPEYTDVFKDYSVKAHIDRMQPMKPQMHSKTSADFLQNTESAENFLHPCVLERAQQTVELTKDEDKQEEWIKDEEEEEEKRNKDEEMRMLVSKLENLNDRPLEIPEYRDAYKNFPRERPKIAKPDDEIGCADGSKVSSPSRAKFPTKIDQDPEYKSKYLDCSRDRPMYRKLPPMLRPTAAISSSHGSSCFFDRVPSCHQKYYASECKPTSEVKLQYIPYGHMPRVEMLRVPTSLQPEGNIELLPEYRSAYCTRYDHHRGYNRDPSVSKGNENYWLNNNNNGHECNKTIIDQGQDAFHVLDTHIHDENIISKPPPTSKRNSRLSQATARSMQSPELADNASARTQSPKPTYRLHVYDVDNEPRCFDSSSFGRIRSPSIDRVTTCDNLAKPYSPSFGRTDTGRQSDRRIDDQSFVVLERTSKISGRSGRADRSRNVDVAMPISRERPKTPTRWMPPWYDNTNAI